jgi:hypothetical protein
MHPMTRRWRVLLAVGLITATAASGNLLGAAKSGADRCDRVPTGVDTSDYFLDFTVPPGLMPDTRFDRRPARIRVHRVQPVYQRGKCPEIAARAAVLIHGRTGSGADTFDLRHPAPGGGTLSVQEGLARAGIDSFAPNLLGYSPSTTFHDGLDDPANASRRPYEADGTTCVFIPRGATAPTIRSSRSISRERSLPSIRLAANDKPTRATSRSPARTYGSATSARSSTTPSRAPSRRTAR